MPEYLIMVSRLENNKTGFFEIFYLIGSCVLMMLIYLPSFRMRLTLPVITILSIGYGILFFRNIVHYIPKIIGIIILYGIINFIVTYPGNFKMGFLHPMMTLWLWVFPVLMCLEMIYRHDRKVIQFSLIFNLILFLIVVFATIKAIEDNPVIMRAITAQNDEEVIDFSSEDNVGGFAIAYSTGGLLILATSVLMVLKSKKINLIICWSIIIISSILVILAQFTTLLLLCFGCLFFVIWQNTTQIIPRLILIIVSILLLLGFESILLWSISYYSDTITGFHLREVYDALYMDADYDNSRKDFLNAAFNLFLSSPIWGNDVENNSYNEFVTYASHSTFLNICVKTGLIGLACFWGTLWSAFKPVYREFRNYSRNIFFGFIFYVVLLSILNPIDNDIISLTFGFTCPLFAYYIYDTSEHKKALA